MGLLHLLLHQQTRDGTVPRPLDREFKRVATLFVADQIVALPRPNKEADARTRAPYGCVVQSRHAVVICDVDIGTLGQ